MNDPLAFITFCIGTILGIILTLYLPISETYRTANQSLDQCEAELPRSQHCVITAIPEMNDGQR